MATQTITPRELASMIAAGKPVTLIDVRTPAEFESVHVSHAANRPLDALAADAVPEAVGHDANHPLYVICQSGARSAKACDKLLAAGLTNVISVEGGTAACVDAGLDIVRGRKAMSLERQVRVATGLLVVIGAVLAWLVHPGFVAMAGAVGAGLVFAGVTDTCAMAMLLARMPWNRGATCNATVQA